jgi:glutathione synthase/RimK-type ligase-like ATP-grasp enzyme
VTKTCLLITDRFEPTADLLIAELRRRQIPCIRWNLDQYPFGSELTFRVSGGRFEVEAAADGRSVDLSDVGSIWYRGNRPTGFPDDLDSEERSFAETGAQRALDALTTVGDFVWINHPARNRRANSKPAQLYVAQQVGLDIPATVITNDPEEARSFIAKSDGEVVYKSLSQNLEVALHKALFTGVLTKKEIANLDLIRLTPGIFQEFVSKCYEVRTTVVGRKLFSARIDSQAHVETKIDWRHLPFEVNDRPIDLPPEVERKVHAVMDAFGLVYGALDFIVTPEGRYVFLEVNPAGQYMWVEAKTGLKITAALVDSLVKPCLS